MPDPALVAYVEAIEAHLGRLRGAEHVLTPRDFALARSWHGAGVALADLLAALDAAHAETGQPPSLAFCRKRLAVTRR